MIGSLDRSASAYLLKKVFLSSLGWESNQGIEPAVYELSAAYCIVALHYTSILRHCTVANGVAREEW